MTWQDYAGVIVGVICIVIGLAYFFSPRFGNVALTQTTQGRFLTRLVGETGALFVSKYVFSLVGIAFGLCCIYVSVVKG